MGSNFSPTRAPCLFFASQFSGSPRRLKSRMLACAAPRARRSAAGKRRTAFAISAGRTGKSRPRSFALSNLARRVFRLGDKAVRETDPAGDDFPLLARGPARFGLRANEATRRLVEVADKNDIGGVKERDLLARHAIHGGRPLVFDAAADLF